MNMICHHELHPYNDGPQLWKDTDRRRIHLVLSQCLLLLDHQQQHQHPVHWQALVNSRGVTGEIWGSYQRYWRLHTLSIVQASLMTLFYFCLTFSLYLFLSPSVSAYTCFGILLILFSLQFVKSFGDDPSSPSPLPFPTCSFLLRFCFCFLFCG